MISLLAVVSNPNDSSIRACQLSADGQWMVAAGDADQAFVWNIDNLSLIRLMFIFSGH